MAGSYSSPLRPSLRPTETRRAVQLSLGPVGPACKHGYALYSNTFAGHLGVIEYSASGFVEQTADSVYRDTSGRQAFTKSQQRGTNKGQSDWLIDFDAGDIRNPPFGDRRLQQIVEFGIGNPPGDRGFDGVVVGL